MLLNKDAAVLRMNKYGNQSKPFLFVVDFACSSVWVGEKQESCNKGVLFNFDGVSNYPSQSDLAGKLDLNQKNITFKEYERAFKKVKSALNRGDSYLLNLTFSTPVQPACSLKDIFHLSRAKYRLLFQDRFVVFSPETFIQIRKGKISTFPMKGTIDAGLPEAESKILANNKEMAEHATVVDLLRNDLSRVATEIKVERYRYVEEIQAGNKNLLQVSSTISGQLAADYKSHLGEILFEMLPAGSISGAPKNRTLEIIEMAETHQRGFYTGVAGYFDGENLDSCVLIRYIEKTEAGFFFKSGGGITFKSKATEEYKELIDKIYVPFA
ncbi:MAG: aminodeoxychorismate synthase component I [Smithellaceae bacterium]|nr:aminodeoxychorismate synthase component I [Smithellaceae bacterium]